MIIRVHPTLFRSYLPPFLPRWGLLESVEEELVRVTQAVPEPCLLGKVANISAKTGRSSAASTFFLSSFPCPSS